MVIDSFFGLRVDEAFYLGWDVAWCTAGGVNVRITRVGVGGQEGEAVVCDSVG